MTPALLSVLLAACSDYAIKPEAEEPALAAGTPVLVVDPPAIDFGVVAPGDAAERAVSVANAGDADLRILTTTLRDADGAFGVTALGDVVLAPGARTSLVVTYAPPRADAFTGALQVVSNAPDAGEATVALSGDTPRPWLVLEPSWADLGAVTVGADATVELVVRNEGAADGTVTTLAFAPTSAELALADDAGLGAAALTLAPGASATLSVRFVPADTGAEQALLVLSTDDAANPELTATIDALGAAPDACSWAAWVSDDDCGGGWPGTGADGDVTLSGTFAPVATALTADAAGPTLPVLSELGFAVDDEVFLHASDGAYAFGRVVGVGSGWLTLGADVAFPAGTVVQRVPHYRSVSVTGPTTGARVVFRACGAVSLDDDLGADGGGWAGGARTVGIPELGWQGAGPSGAGVQSDAPNGIGGGGGSSSCNVHADGGGGGHATDGTEGGDWDSYVCGGPGGQGGGTIGEPSLAALHFGGGGGSGYLDTDAGAGSYGGAGGAGGGLVYLVARDGFLGAGTVRADGAAGEDGVWATSGASPGGGGGGAGGSVRLVGDVEVSVRALGGNGGVGSEAGTAPTAGGTGGDGRIRVDGLLLGSASPSAYEACP